MLENNDKNSFAKICKKANLKITPQREIIYKILSGTDQHPSVEMVYEKARQIFPNISFDTVNRTLNTFVDIGVAFVVEGGSDVRRFDAAMDPHQHFKCIKCGKIYDFHSSWFENIVKPPELDNDFEVLNMVVYFKGICKKCKIND